MNKYGFPLFAASASTQISGTENMDRLTEEMSRIIMKVLEAIY